jgi:hypothetical protein
MSSANKKCGVTFDERRHCHAGQTETDDRAGGGLFAKEWEVFVARFDKELGRFVTSTFCCEEEVPFK